MPVSILSELRNQILDKVLAKHSNSPLLGKGFKVGSFQIPNGVVATGDRVYMASGNNGTFLGVNPRAKKMPLIFEGFDGKIYSAGVGAVRTIISAE